MVKIQDPITIVGDVHGQFYDFIKIVDDDTGGPLETTKYIFLGDYVDRGSFSVEVLGLILAIKIKLKNTIFMLRGNHECRQLTSFFNFRTECISKYDQEIYDQVMDLFDHLPISAIINNKFLCIHGGISTDIASVLPPLPRLLTFRRSTGSRKCLNQDYFVTSCGRIQSITIQASWNH